MPAAELTRRYVECLEQFPALWSVGVGITVMKMPQKGSLGEPGRPDWGYCV